MATTRPFRRRRLGRELAALRKAAKLTVNAVGAEAGVDGSTVTRIETGKTTARLPTVRALLDTYGVTGDKRTALLELARSMNRPAYWHSFGDVLPDWFQLYVDLEAEASELAIYDCQFVNGLVQTEDYARVQMTCRPEVSVDEIERQVELRMHHQKRVLNGELKLRLILDEQVLHRRFGDAGADVIARQFDHLLEVAELRTVSMQVLPRSAKASAVGSFHLMDFLESIDPSVVYIEHEGGALYLEKMKEIRKYVRTFDHLRAAALSPEALAAHIVQLRKEL